MVEGVVVEEGIRIQVEALEGCFEDCEVCEGIAFQEELVVLVDEISVCVVIAEWSGSCGKASEVNELN